MERKESDSDRETQSDRDRQRDTEQESSSSTAESRSAASLHGTVGNQAVQRLHMEDILQANLAVSQPTDPAEREARGVAEQVMNASDERRVTAGASGAEPPGGGGPGGSTQSAVPPVVDRTPRIEQSPPSGGTGGDRQADEDVERALVSSSGGKPLPPAARSFFEPRFGRDFGDVRVHTGSEAADLNRRLDAKAFTHGSDVYFGEGQYRPGSAGGKQLLAHELTHVVQQTEHGGDIGRIQGRVIQRNGDRPSTAELRERELEDLFETWVKHDYQHTSVQVPAPARDKIKYVIRYKLDTKDRETLQWWLDNDPYVNHANGFWLREAIRYRRDKKGEETGGDETREEPESPSGRVEEIPEGKAPPSPEFDSGVRVETTSGLRIRDGPGLDSSIRATAPEGVNGVVVSGPRMQDAYWWWKIEYDVGYTGWSAQTGLTKSPVDKQQGETTEDREESFHLERWGAKIAPLEPSLGPGNNRRMKFNRALSRSEAVEYIWQGKYDPPWMGTRPSLRPDESTYTEEGYYRAFFIHFPPKGHRDHEQFWLSMRSEVYNLPWEGAEIPSIDPETGELETPGVDLPGYAPKSLGDDLLSGKLFEQRDADIVTGRRDRVVRSFLYYGENMGSGALYLSFVRLYPVRRSWYQKAITDEDEREMIRESSLKINHDLTNLVVNKKMRPSRARQKLRNKYRHKLMMQLLGLMNSSVSGGGGIPKVVSVGLGLYSLAKGIEQMPEDLKEAKERREAIESEEERQTAAEREQKGRPVGSERDQGSPHTPPTMAPSRSRERER